MKPKKPKKIKIAWVLAAVVLLIIGVYALTKNKQNKPKSEYDEFAQCLTEKGAVMYGTYWCSHCKAQKEGFGDSFKYVNYVECTEDPDTCTEKGIEGFPTWIINGVKYAGRQPLPKLAELTQCESP